MIILAHVEPPELIFQLRNFDVPLMVMIAGISFLISYDENERYHSPVWLFLTGYFTVLFIVTPSNPDLDFRTIIGSYLLVDGIGYVWIIRVFILVSLVSPLIYLFHKKIRSDALFFTIIIATFLLYEAIRYLSLPYIDSGLWKAISLITHYVIPYTLIFTLGLRLKSLSLYNFSSLLLVSGSIFVLLGLYLYHSTGTLVPTQAMKYPPSMYYFSYAVFISCILFKLSVTLAEHLKLSRVSPIISFCARNSIWVYLWHIPFIDIYNTTFLLKYVLVFSTAIAITKVQVTSVIYMAEKIQNGRYKKGLKSILTG